MTAGAVVVVLAGGGAAWGLTRGAGDSYRTAVAADGTVVQSLAATGTVSPVSDADESFQVDGTVSHVAVKEGQQVRAGEVLGYLNRSDLRSELRSARSALTEARSRMTDDETGQSIATGDSPQGSNDGSSQGSTPTFEAAQPHVVLTPSPTGGASSGRPTGGAPTGGSPSGSGGLASAQAAVREAQQSTDAALAEAGDALKAADEACATSTSTTSQPTTPTDPTSSPDPVSTPTAEPTTTTSGDACTTAGAALLADEQAVDHDERQLAAAEGALTKILSSMSTSSANGSHSATGSHSTPSTDHEATSASAADIALDQASIDQALSTVDADQASLDQATLRATITGRVAAVTVAHGDQVTASSSSPAFIVVGSRQEQATIDLSATDIREVKVGMTANVAPDGLSRVLAGRVVSVDAAGIESSEGTVAFPVTIALPSGTNVVSGAAASVTLVIASIDHVLAVPTSAVHYSGTTAYVELLRAGKEVRKTVKVGAIGAALTEIESGISAGDSVVLADLNTAVPSSSSSLTGGGLFGGGGGGAGFARRFAGGGGGTGFGAVTVPVGPAG